MDVGAKRPSHRAVRGSTSQWPPLSHGSQANVKRNPTHLSPPPPPRKIGRMQRRLPNQSGTPPPSTPSQRIPPEPASSSHDEPPYLLSTPGHASKHFLPCEPHNPKSFGDHRPIALPIPRCLKLNESPENPGRFSYPLVERHEDGRATIFHPSWTHDGNHRCRGFPHRQVGSRI